MSPGGRSRSRSRPSQAAPAAPRPAARRVAFAAAASLLCSLAAAAPSPSPSLPVAVASSAFVQPPTIASIRGSARAGAGARGSAGAPGVRSGDAGAAAGSPRKRLPLVGLDRCRRRAGFPPAERGADFSSSSTRLRSVPSAAAAVAASAAVAAASSAVAAPPTRGLGSYYLVRILFLRGLALVHSVAFLVAYGQNRGLIGDDGVTPARKVLDDAEERGRRKRERREEWLEEWKNYAKDAAVGGAGVWGMVRGSKIGRAAGDRLNHAEWYKSLRERLWDRSDRMDRPVTTVLWLARDRSRLNRWLDGVALAGLGLSAAVFAMGAANVPLLLGMWVCQRSLMAVGGPWYGYGWEPQLAELGFHALFLVPALSLSPLASPPVPPVVAWAVRWHLFRIMMGAGLIKVKSGDPKWRLRNPEGGWGLTAMDHFYETQPVPNPLTKYFHAAPRWWHKFEVLTNHFVELVAPWLIILPGLPRGWRIAGGVIQLAFQGVLISSGNLSFLNWLTALPALFCLDDAFLSKLFAPLKTASASVAAYTRLAERGGPYAASPLRRLVDALFGLLVVRLSVPVVRNLLAERQLMNASFDPLRLINAYGAFGTVSEDRDELIVKSTDDVARGEWREYEFKVKPGDVYRRPRFVSPYHYRLDWQMWIAAQAGGVERSPWMYSLLLKLLRQEEDVAGLLAKDPWAAAAAPSGGRDTEDGGGAEEGGDGNGGAGGRRKPRYIQVEKYRYKFNYNMTADDDGKGRPPYWTREYVGRYFPRQGIMTEDMLADYIR